MPALYETILIPCGKAKLDTKWPVPARDLYIGGYFRALYNAAIRLTPRVLIVSAGYGLLELEDLVLPYERKMDRTRAAEFRRLRILHFKTQTYHMLPAVYCNAFPISTHEIPLIPRGLGMGAIKGYVKRWHNLPVVGNRTPPGRLRELIP